MTTQKMTNRDLLNLALPLVPLSSAEWGAVKNFSVESSINDTDETFKSAMSKLTVNQSRIETFQELLMGRLGKVGAFGDVVNDGISSDYQIFLGNIISFE